MKEENKIRKNLNKKLKNNKAITLIALVITIMVLIILAGVSINLVLGDNGIITKAKQGKENYLVAANEEQEMLTNVEEYLGTLGTITPTPPVTPQYKTVEEYKTSGTYMTGKTTLKDSNDNLIVVPEGFKIAEDSGINITEGIVIEDNDIKEGIGNNRGNQYVWIPVGNTLKKSDGSSINIELGRYVFADGTNHKGEDGVEVLPAGTPILMQSAEDYGNETEIHITDIDPTLTSNYAFKELKDYRTGVVSAGLDGLNATAKNLKGFIESVKTNGGYYIARYEASYGEDGKVNSKVSNSFISDTTVPTVEGQLWNNITQINASIASQGLYSTINSDLMNSYAWDTAIVYIQNFSNDTDYSRQNSLNTSLANTGANGDEVCKINDIASNTTEWTTEYSSYTAGTTASPCAYRGGVYSPNTYYTSIRTYGRNATYNHQYLTFRPTLYV